MLANCPTRPTAGGADNVVVAIVGRSSGAALMIHVGDRPHLDERFQRWTAAKARGSECCGCSTVRPWAASSIDGPDWEKGPRQVHPRCLCFAATKKYDVLPRRCQTTKAKAGACLHIQMMLPSSLNGRHPDCLFKECQK